ncbi:MAG TPA: NADH-quinone oxidoreductase subunit NuoH [Anaerolineae bacterium]|nr:NADH-quinone oxidoreductase subunit NuoH [Anaerolineae bacterium]
MDPVLTNIIVWLVLSIVIVFAVVTGFAYTTLLERRVIARFQSRVGPNRAGPQGLLQPLADGIKLIFKEEVIPATADKFTFILAPMLAVIPALVVFAVIPFGSSIEVFGVTVPLTIAPHINVGVLYILAITSISVYGIVLAGWASNSKYSMLGSLRSSAQMISYELAMGLSLVALVVVAGTLDLNTIVEQQKQVWYVFLQPFGAIIFMITALAEVNRAPFDMPEAEQELTSGYNTEYSGMKFALFYMAEYIKMIVISALAVTFFFGGYREPFPLFITHAVPFLSVDNSPLLGPVYFGLKIVMLLIVQVWVRATLPRFRYDRLMKFGWLVLLPISLAWVMITAFAVLMRG